MTRLPDADDLLAGLDAELADVARRLVADAQGHAPRSAFAQRLAGELRSSVGAGQGAADGTAGHARPPAPDDLGGGTPQPPLWAKVAVGILSLTLVYGLIASIFRPSTTPPVAEPTPTSTVTVPASTTRPPHTATPTPSSTVQSTPSASPTTASSPALAGPVAPYFEATPIANPTPSATRTAAPTIAPTVKARSRTATPTQPRPIDTVPPSATPLPTDAPTPSDRPKPSPTESEPSATPPTREPDERPTPTHQPPTPTADECRERCTKKSQEFYAQCIAGGGTPAYCRERQAEHHDQCMRDECEPAPVP